MALFAMGVLALDAHATNSALARVLRECGQGQVPDDEAVFQYCTGLIQVCPAFVSVFVW